MSASLIQRFGTPQTILRDTNGQTTLNGKVVANTRDTLTVTASVQPMKGREIMESGIGGERISGAIKIYSFDELKTNTEATGLAADMISYQGQNYEVRKVEPWQGNNRGIEFYKSIAVLVNKELD